MECSAEEQKREILPILKRAQEVSASDPKMEYYCKLHAVDKAMSFKSRSPEVRDVLMAVLKQLECQKAELQLDREVDALHCAEFARDVFSRARARDEAGEIDVTTATTYNAACIFLEVASQFDTPVADLQQMRQHAAKRTREIRSKLFAAGASGTGTTGPEASAGPEADSAAGVAAADSVTSSAAAVDTASAGCGAPGEDASAGAAASEARSELPRQEEAALGAEHGEREAAGPGEGSASLQLAAAEQSPEGATGANCVAEAGVTAEAGRGGADCGSVGPLPSATKKDRLASADAATASLDGCAAALTDAAEDELSDGLLLPESRPDSPPYLHPAASPNTSIPDGCSGAIIEPQQLPVPLGAHQLLQLHGGAAAAAADLDPQRFLALVSGLPPPLAAAAASHFMAPPSTRSAAVAAEELSLPPAWPESLPSPPSADSSMYPSLDLLQAAPWHAAPAPAAAVRILDPPLVPPVLANGHGNHQPSPPPSPPQSSTRPSAAAISEAQHAARTAVSSLNFEDTHSAVQHLQRALALLTPR